MNRRCVSYCLLFLFLPILLTGCTRFSPPADVTIIESTAQPADVVAIDTWPDTALFAGFPIPPGTFDWGLHDDTYDFWSIQIGDLNQAGFDRYYQQLLDAGFQRIDKLEGTSGGPCISLGTLLSNGDCSVSIAYAEPVLMLTVTDHSLSGSTRHLFASSTMNNIYLKAYSTNDTQSGIHTVAILYSPTGKRPIPVFTAVRGFVTVTIGENTQRFYLGNEFSSASSIGLTTASGIHAPSGATGTVIVSGTACATNAAAGSGSFCAHYSITVP